MGKILSVIVPTYNMEKYLGYCLDSLIVENKDAIEVLVINDGSTDGSLVIAKSYQMLYPELFRVIDKSNGNYGSCINRGLKEATGKYVKILDADDSFDSKNFNSFIDFLKSQDADLILSDFKVVDENRSHLRTVHYGFSIQSNHPFQKLCSNTDFTDAIQMHAVAYRFEMLRSMKYHQTEGISYTDQQWIFTPMINVKSVSYFDKAVYRYLIGRDGQTMDPKVKMRSMEHARKNSFGLVSDYEKHKNEINNNQALRFYLHSRLAWYIKDIYVYYICHYSKANAPILRDYDKKLRYLSNEIYEFIGSKNVSSFHGFTYIDYWRKHKIPTLLVKVLGKVYKSMLDTKAKHMSNNNSLSIGI
jgi:hypothetical protein